VISVTHTVLPLWYIRVCTTTSGPFQDMDPVAQLGRRCRLKRRPPHGPHVPRSTYLFYILCIARFGIVKCILSNEERSKSATVSCDATTPCADQGDTWESIMSPDYGSREKDGILTVVHNASGLDPMAACPPDLFNFNNDVFLIESQVSRHRPLRP
jgi:hypothetical protein